MKSNVMRGAGKPALVGVLMLAAAGATAGITSAAPDRQNSKQEIHARSDTPENLVEDFNYPGADSILASRGIVLRRGDGRIMLADCGAAGLIQLKSRDKGDVCFRATGKDGFLTMEIPSVFLIYGGDHNLAATLTPDAGPSKTYDVPANLWKSVGETDTGTPAKLVEIRIAK
ncbi:hypothetical protein [Amycolatopsis sp. NPDC004079]|uniref:hypothetical protein n=1 Tax=Amycolatopsis sp. NPDC004079 TaxID=3154549 RepID=UPI0033B5229D